MSPSDVIALIALALAVFTIVMGQRRNGGDARRIAELEATVKALRNRIEELERMYVDALARESKLRDEVSRLEDELSKARERIAELEKSIGMRRVSVLAIYPERDDITNPAPALYDAGIDYVLLTGRVRREDVVLALEEGDFCIVEVDAHGTRTEGREIGGIELSDGLAEAGWWARVLRRSNVKAVVLMSCSTMDVARALKRAGIPKVIAVDGDILDSAAFTFIKNMYASLASGDDIEEAVRVAKLTVSREQADMIRVL